MRAWVTASERQLKELAEQRAQLDEAMAELQRLHDDTVGELEKRSA
jgi:ppGpp synthetase/RelA/SpoT-type nucleotidyltranferase